MADDLGAAGNQRAVSVDRALAEVCGHQGVWDGTVWDGIVPVLSEAICTNELLGRKMPFCFLHDGQEPRSAHPLLCTRFAT